MSSILYLSGTRADYGLLRSCLSRMHKHPRIDLSICVTGSHLSQQSGYTVSEIEADGLNIVDRITVGGHQSSGLDMGAAFGDLANSFATTLDKVRPDWLMILGDRYEMLAAAAVAVMQNIPIAHIHGGERSGTVDELFRHAISKLSHLHLVATQGSAQRLERMGEDPARIQVVGAPGLDDVVALSASDRESVTEALGLRTDKPYALIVYHPVVQEQAEAEVQVAAVLNAASRSFEQAVVLAANTDPGGLSINTYLRDHPLDGFHVRTHLSREKYLAVLQHASILIGNSSSGIIEAASLGTPVINVGSRQNAREANANVVTVKATEKDISSAIKKMGPDLRYHGENIYGDGKAGDRIIAKLLSTSPTAEFLKKTNAY